MKVTSKYFEVDTACILLSEIAAIALTDVGKPDKRWIVHLKSGTTVELPLCVTAHFKSNISSFKKYLGI